MIRPVAFIVAVGLLGMALADAQEPARLVLPKLSGANPDGSNLPDPNKDRDPTVKLYASPREAALAAFQAGYKSATSPQPNRERAMGMFLLSLRRDPTLAKSLYNLGILCAQDSRWDDAITFQNEFLKQPELEAAWKKSSTDELERLRTIARLERNPEGKLRKRYDIALWRVLQIKDPIKALNEVNGLIQIDKNRWEGPSLAGIFHAETKAFSESVKALDEATRLAPPDRKANVQSAADAARNEATFAEQLKVADVLWEKQQYAPAGEAYQKAWKTIRTRVESGMRSATSFLMADQIAPAVEILSQLRDYAPADTVRKASAMLQELGKVSQEAKAAAARTPAASQIEPPVETAAFIRLRIGTLSNSEVDLVVKSGAPLLRDSSIVTPIPDEALAGGRSDMVFLTTDSIFLMYKRDRDIALAADARRAAALEPPAPVAPEPQPITPGPPVAAPSAPTAARNPAPAEPAAIPPAAPARLGRSGDGQEQPVTVNSTPPGATILVDENGLKCVARCELRLAPGRHTLRATLEGYTDAVRIFNVEKGKALSLDVSLDSNVGFVNVETKTPGMPIYVNGKKTGSVTPARLKLAEGEYVVGVEIDGQMTSGKVSVKAGVIGTITLSQ